MGFWRRKKGAEPVDAIATYDRVLEDLERRGAQVRKSAATLLAIRGDLQRDRDRTVARLVDIRGRLEKAAQRGDAPAERVLRRDELQSQKMIDAAAEALAQAEADAELLLEAAQEIADRVGELRAERTSAKTRMAAGQVVTGTLREEHQRVEQVLALDAARDEVERAHQLAQIYREERKAKDS